MKILVTGGGGQLADAIMLAARGPERGGFDLTILGRAELDITSVEAVRSSISVVEPDVVVNTAAYTNVDEAEVDGESAMEVNGTAVGVIAEEAMAAGARLVQISTDFVFDGTASSPIPTDAQPAPVSSYGVSKRRGEELCIQKLGDRAAIIRTSWLYGSGHRNFVATMLRLMRSRDEISVVSDQIGTPTWTMTLANSVLDVIRKEVYGIHHVSDSGAASWFDFAVAIADISRRNGLLARDCRVHPISTDEFPTPAVRPSYSVLDKRSTWAEIGTEAPHWTHSLERCLSNWKDPLV